METGMSAHIFSLVIRGGTVIDGTGSDPVQADVGICGDRIMQIGANLPPGETEIDAKNLLVTPGFVDIHTHYDGQAIWDDYLAPSSWHGVTTAVMGNCGVGFAPVHSQSRENLIKLMEGVEDIPGPVLHEGLDFNWESFSDYLEVIERRHRDIDICAQLPHAALRLYVMGERAMRLEDATDSDIAAMRQLAKEAMLAGALGFSTSRTLNHRTLAGDPTPTLRATEAELTGIAMGLRDAGTGMLQVVSDWDAPDPETEFSMLRRVVEVSGRPLVYTVNQRHDEHKERWKKLLAMGDQAAAEGLSMRPVFPPRPIGILLGLQGSQNPFSACPSYRAIQSLALPERVRAMGEPTLRAKILSEDRFAESTFPLLNRLSWDRMFPFGEPPEYEPSKEGSIASIANKQGRKPEEVAYDLLLSDEGKSFILAAMVNYADYTLDACAVMLKNRNAIAGLSDGGAHVGFISDGSIPTHLLTHWGRDRNRDRFPLPELIQRLTSDTAHAVGLHDRGVIAPGLKADINVIDFGKLRIERPYMVYDLPAGGRRLMQKAHGYVATIVSGVITYRNGEPTGRLPGTLVRGVQQI
jgi:N-acyl-D-aspartate/D-glutamate deacylase